MAENKILPFAVNDTGSNLLTDSEYHEDVQRLTGNQPGIARSKLINKALKQSSLMVSALAQSIVDSYGVDLNDEMTVSEISAFLLNLNRTPGEVGFFCFSTPPRGWLLANGTQVSREKYAFLFAAIGTSFGVGDGKTTFNLPDLRGEFIRGVDFNRGVDAGRILGSWQESQNRKHKHNLTVDSAGGHTHVYNLTTATPNSTPGGVYNLSVVQSISQANTSLNGEHIHSGWANDSGGEEVRVRNIALALFIYAGV